ncbi:MAG: hypothetical protein SV186_06820 [Candidatus Nanohaloarchaea archaeon]|nr:hypothetical protein [Candidatus Nanohaloarchaea archaeon]
MTNPLMDLDNPTRVYVGVLFTVAVGLSLGVGVTVGSSLDGGDGVRRIGDTWVLETEVTDYHRYHATMGLVTYRSGTAAPDYNLSVERTLRLKCHGLVRAFLQYLFAREMDPAAASEYVRPRHPDYGATNLTVTVDMEYAPPGTLRMVEKVAPARIRCTSRLRDRSLTSTYPVTVMREEEYNGAVIAANRTVELGSQVESIQ